MKATGIVRRLDDLGRIVIPKEIRRVNNLGEGDAMEIYVDKEGEIILKKYIPDCGCVFCGSDENVVDFNGKKICGKCAKKINYLVNG